MAGSVITPTIPGGGTGIIGRTAGGATKPTKTELQRNGAVSPEGRRRHRFYASACAEAVSSWLRLDFEVLGRAQPPRRRSYDKAYAEPRCCAAEVLAVSRV